MDTGIIEISVIELKSFRKWNYRVANWKTALKKPHKMHNLGRSVHTHRFVYLSHILANDSNISCYSRALIL